jgi:hypothetical protein
VITLPYHTEIINFATSRPIPACVVLLDDAVARTSIDGVWWTGFSHNERQKHEDGKWNWEELAKWFGGKPEYSCVALATPFDYVHGAMAINLDGQMVSGETAVKIERLAAAPYTRRIANPRRYRGCGEALVAYASAVSYSLNGQGTITLSALSEAIPFYEGIGFKNTGKVDLEGLPVYELEQSEAMDFLRVWKVVP